MFNVVLVQRVYDEEVNEDKADKEVSEKKVSTI